LLNIQKALLEVCSSGGTTYFSCIIFFSLLVTLSFIVNESDKDYLGIRDFRLVHTLLQVIISWGFYPCFLPGVGVPLSKRVKSGYTNHGKHLVIAHEQNY
jgi:hypothetical protein